MLKLKNVSKFYYNKGVIASGFSKVNISFSLGEFVAIVGESGSGKSTLLNVISGLDSYEEGEMYINGEETSHYGEADFEEYRKKYVSNVFQNFNLVNSYTVYQNVELVMLLNGYKRKEVKQKVQELITKVGLKKYRNTKVSKLSGGQKQRVAIARALAKETPIIVCDEPTGNLDSKSAKEVIKLLKEISKDKLVIVVTHNYAEIEELATRVVKMHDGKIVSDKKISETDKIDAPTESRNKNIGFFNIFRLGFRNTFNILSKFVLIFIVFFFVTSSLLSTYASNLKNDYENGRIGVNYYFSNTDDKRIIIKKKDGSPITSDDFNKISELEHVSKVVENDIILDEQGWFETTDDDYYNVSGILEDIKNFDGELDYGRMPEKANEAIYLVSEYDYYFAEKLDAAIDKTYYYQGDSSKMNLKVVGVKYIKYNSNFFDLNDYNSVIYVSNDIIDEVMKDTNKMHSNITININNKNYASYTEPGFDFSIVPSNRVPKGSAYVKENINYTCKDYNCKNKSLTINLKNLYYTDKLDLKITNVYTDNNIKSLLWISKDNPNNGSIFINDEEYYNLFNKDSYQASVIVDDIDNIDLVDTNLDSLGYTTLQIRHTLVNMASEIFKVLKIFKLVILIVTIITLFFISYFVIKLILKSRNIYFSTLRILGANYRHIKRILDIELFTNASLAYLVYIGLTILVKNNIISLDFINNILEYLHLKDYILMYIILVVMSYLISSRYASKIFKKSAMNTYREEV